MMETTVVVPVRCLHKIMQERDEALARVQELEDAMERITDSDYPHDIAWAALSKKE